MAVGKKVKTETTEITVIEISEGSVTLGIVGTSPFVFNRMSEKAKRELLYPRGGKKKPGESLKHDPLLEYRDSVYRETSKDAVTRLLFPAAAFKKAIATAALDMPGAAKAEIGRLTWAEGFYVPIYGVPKLWMAVVRMKDISRTPDIRSRAILPEWCSIVTFRFVRPNLNEQTMFSLGVGSGRTVGVGDGRQEKGTLSMGQYRPVSHTDLALMKFMKENGRVPQDKALANPEFFDAESEDLFHWFQEERVKREGKKKEAA